MEGREGGGRERVQKGRKAGLTTAGLQCESQKKGILEACTCRNDVTTNCNFYLVEYSRSQISFLLSHTSKLEAVDQQLCRISEYYCINFFCGPQYL